MYYQYIIIIKYVVSMSNAKYFFFNLNQADTFSNAQ